MAKGGVNCYLCDGPASGACPRCGNFVCTAHRHTKGWLALCDRCRKSATRFLAVYLLSFVAVIIPFAVWFYFYLNGPPVIRGR